MSLDNRLVQEYLLLRPKDKVPSGWVSSHLHLFVRQLLLDVSPPVRLVLGLIVEARYVQLSVPILTPLPQQKADSIFPLVLQELCMSYLRENRKLPDMGRPTRITVADYKLARYLKDHIGKDGTSVVNFVWEGSQLIPGLNRQNCVALNSITDAHSIDMGSCMSRELNGMPIVERMADGRLQRVSDCNTKETFRASKTEPGTFRSRVGKSHTVPPRLNFCCACGNIGQTGVAAAAAAAANNSYEHEGCSSLQICSGCKEAMYCSLSCQKKDWKDFHQAECKKVAPSTGNHK